MIVHPSENVSLGCNDSLQSPPDSLLLGCAETAQLNTPNQVLQLEFRSSAVTIMCVFTACFMITSLASPFLLPFHVLIYVTDVVNSFLLVWASLNLVFGKRRIIMNLDQYKALLIYGNMTNYIAMAYAVFMSPFYLGVIIVKTTSKSLIAQCARTLLSYALQLVIILGVNVTSTLS